MLCKVCFCEDETESDLTQNKPHLICVRHKVSTYSASVEDRSKTVL